MVWSPAFFGVKPDMVLRGGMIAAALMGDPNASIPTPQPVHYRPMYGAYGRALTATAVTFLPAVAIERGLPAALGIERMVLPARGIRAVGKAQMVHNNATPHGRGRSRDLRGARRRRPPHLRAGDGTADGAAVFPVLMFIHNEAVRQ